jgi:hypothetical protein
MKGWVCRVGWALRHIIGGIVMIVMIGWVCRFEWALRPYYRRDSYDSYDRLGM